MLTGKEAMAADAGFDYSLALEGVEEDDEEDEESSEESDEDHDIPVTAGSGPHAPKAIGAWSEGEVNSAQLVEILSSLPLFRGCSRKDDGNEGLVEAVASQASCFFLGAQQELELGDGYPLYVVVRGAVKVSTDSTAESLGPGTALNMPGFLGVLSEAEPFMQSSDDDGGADDEADGRLVGDPPYQLVGPTPVQTPQLFMPDRRKQIPTAERTNSLNSLVSDDQLNFYNLCPHAATVFTDSGMRRGGGWTDMKVEGVRIDRTYRGQEGRRPDFDGRALVAAIPLQAVEVASRGGLSIARFRENVIELRYIWLALLKQAGPMLPHVHPQVMWVIGARCHRRTLKTSEMLTIEGEIDENIYIVTSGTAVVEKLVGVNPSLKAAHETIGRLGPGAIVGDLCLVGAAMPRAASVRARTPIRVIALPGPAICEPMRRLPMIAAAMGPRLKTVASFIQAKLPICHEVLATVSVFSECDDAFLRAVSAERRAFYAGHTFDKGMDREGVVYVVEFGECGIEVPGRGIVTEMSAGRVFGVGAPLLVGPCEIPPEDGIVRVITPILAVLAIQKKSLMHLLNRFTVEKQRFGTPAEIGDGNPDGDSLNATGRRAHAERLEVFRECGRGFVDRIFCALERKSYMPGQTIVCMGAQDASQMFILESGHVAIEKNRHRTSERSTGTTFGELVMLGVNRRRTTTIRALSFCITLEIPRKTLLAALDEFPEERPRFEQLAMRHMNLDDTDQVLWPFMRGMPHRMLLLLNVHAGRRMCPADDPSLATPAVKQSAVLVLQGQLALKDPAGRTVQRFNVGESYNEGVLVGITNSSSEHLVPTIASEVQIVSKDIFDKVLRQNPTEEEEVCSKIHEVVAQKVELRLGVKPGGTDMLRKAPLLHSTSEEFLQAVRQRLRNHAYMPGRTITEEGREGDAMILLLQGEAGASRPGVREPLSERLGPGAVVGEANLVGISRCYRCTVKATTICLTQAFRHVDLVEVLTRFPDDRRLLDVPVLEAERQRFDTLNLRVRQSMTFLSCAAPFLEIMCRYVDDAFFPPGELIIDQDDPFVIGQSPVYLILAGQAIAENDRGLTLCIVNPGEILGEAAIVGFSEKRTASVRAHRDSVVHCARIDSHSLMEALEKYPLEKQVLINLCNHRHARNTEFAKRREKWLEETAVPGLLRSSLFGGCPKSSIKLIATPLTEAKYAPGAIIASAGEPADAMLVLLEGQADLETQCGLTIGHLSDGATFGEVSALGLFSTRTATVRAASQCRVLQVEATTLAQVLERRDMTYVRQRVATVVAQRREQVLNGLPMSSLGLDITSDDVCAKAIALQAERLIIAAGATLEPLPDSSPCGPHFCILMKGRADVEPREFLTGTRPVMAYGPGSIILDGLLSDYGARLRARTACELCRIRQSDFMIAVTTVPSEHEWFYRYRLMDREMRDRLTKRLQCAKGAHEASKSRPGTGDTGNNAADWQIAWGAPLSQAELALTSPPEDDATEKLHSKQPPASTADGGEERAWSRGSSWSKHPSGGLGSRPGSGQRSGSAAGGYHRAAKEAEGEAQQEQQEAAAGNAEAAAAHDGDGKAGRRGHSAERARKKAALFARYPGAEALEAATHVSPLGPLSVSPGKALNGKGPIYLSDVVKADLARRRAKDRLRPGVLRHEDAMLAQVRLFREGLENSATATGKQLQASMSLSCDRRSLSTSQLKKHKASRMRSEDKGSCRAQSSGPMMRPLAVAQSPHRKRASSAAGRRIFPMPLGSEKTLGMLPHQL